MKGNKGLERGNIGARTGFKLNTNKRIGRPENHKGARDKPDGDHRIWNHRVRENPYQKGLKAEGPRARG